MPPLNKHENRLTHLSSHSKTHMHNEVIHLWTNAHHGLLLMDNGQRQTQDNFPRDNEELVLKMTDINKTAALEVIGDGTPKHNIQ